MPPNCTKSAQAWALQQPITDEAGASEVQAPTEQLSEGS